MLKEESLTRRLLVSTMGAADCLAKEVTLPPTPEGGQNLVSEVQGQHPQWRIQGTPPSCGESFLEL